MARKKYNEAIEIAPDVYWVGYYDETANFHCNPYLVVSGGEAILIDPGSNPNFPTVARKISSVIKFSKIKYIIIHHQDPDLASNIPVFEKVINRKDLKIITTKRVSFLTNYYGFKSPYRFVEDGPLSFNGRKFRFVKTPYLHAPGAFTTYDEKNKILFSSDIFGAFSDDWDIYAGDNYPEQMEKFHGEYMPPCDVLKNKMKEFAKMDIDLIAPQHGSVIKKELVAKNIKALENMKTGGYLKK